MYVRFATPGQVWEVEVEDLVEDCRVDPLPDTGVLRRPQAGCVDDRIARARGILALEVGHLDHMNLVNIVMRGLVVVVSRVVTEADAAFVF